MTLPTLKSRDLQRALALLVFVVATALAWLKPLDSNADAYLKSGLGRALATYAVARSINGIVSVIQETGVGLQPGGVGVSLAPGQVLDPLNDMVEQFSSIMLAVCVSYGIQLALLKIGGTALVSLGLSIALAWWAWCVWRGRRLTQWQTMLVVGAVIVRFGVPLVASASEWAYQLTLTQEYAQSQQGLRATVADIEKAAPAQAPKTAPGVPKDPGSWTDKLRDLIGVDALVEQAKAKYEHVARRLDNAVEDMIRLIAVFAIQTVVLPLLFLWLLGQLAARLFSPRTRAT